MRLRRLPIAFGPARADVWVAWVLPTWTFQTLAQINTVQMPSHMKFSIVLHCTEIESLLSKV